MARFNIVDITTGEVKHSGAPRYNGTYCKPSYLEFTEISSPEPINWKVRDYVAYSRTGMTYRLYDIPQPKKQSRRSEYGGAFVYQNVQFFADTKWLDIEPFRDVVLGDNDVHFSTRESWSVWANVASLLDRMQAVMDASGGPQFSFRLVDADEGTDLYELLYNNYQDFAISGESVLGGLGKIYEMWGNIGWLHTIENGINVITVGIPPIRVEDVGSDVGESFLYGKGQGLTGLKKSSTNKEELRTRLFVYGSTRNMIPRYYNNILPHIKDHDSVDIQHLMLPLSSWGSTDGEKDASKAYIENNTAEYGLRPTAVYFDGSEQEEIYPSIEKATIGNIYDAMAVGTQYRPNLSKWSRSARLDEVVSASGITDDGMQSSDGGRYTQTQEASTTARSRGASSSFTTYILENLQLDYSGKVTLDFAGLAATIADANANIATLDCTLVVAAGGRVASVDIPWVWNGSAYTMTLPQVEFDATEDDRLYISLNVNFSQKGEPVVLQFSIPAGDISLQYSANYPNTFTIRIPQIGFDISKRASLGGQGLATIAMRDGMCGGRSFVVKACAYVSSADAWDITVYRGKDTGLDMLFPNTSYPVASGDHFVLLDISMPELYIGLAEQRLLAAGQALLDDVSRIKPFYEPEINSEYVYSEGVELHEGWYMPIKDPEITSGQIEYILIDTLTINEGESNIPTYRVTLREQKRTTYSATGTSAGSSLESLAGGSSPERGKSGVRFVGLSMPEGFSVENSPITDSGEISVTLLNGYNLLTDAEKAIINYFGYDETHNAIYVKDGKNFYSFGSVSSGGIGSGGGGGEGGVGSIKVNGTQYLPDTTGMVTLPNYPTSLNWADIQNKPSWIGSSKPSYAFSEITGTLAATQVPTLAISKVSGLQDALDSKSPKTYTHTQNTAAKEWTIQHNLGERPSVVVVNSLEVQVYGDVKYLDNNSVKVSFSTPFSGKAYLN